MTGVDLVRSVAAVSPGIGALLDEHVQENGEILPHVFFGVELTPYVMALLIRSDSDADRELSSVLDLLEERFSKGDPEEENVIAVSFLENTPRSPHPGGELRARLGPSLAQELRRLDGAA